MAKYDGEFNEGVVACLHCSKGQLRYLRAIEKYVSTHDFDCGIDVETLDFKAILGELNLLLPEIREVCAECRNADGEYKSDLIFSLFLAALVLEKQVRLNKKREYKGRHSSRTLRYGKAYLNMRAKDMSVRDIAKELGISSATVVNIGKDIALARDFLKKFKNIQNYDDLLGNNDFVKFCKELNVSEKHGIHILKLVGKPH